MENDVVTDLTFLYLRYSGLQELIYVDSESDEAATENLESLFEEE